MKVSAIVLTRGDSPLDSILESLEAVDRIDEVVIWDNSVEADLKVWGRHAALMNTVNDVIYSQDDDILHTPEGINRILDAYIPGHLVGCMWPEWSRAAEKQGIYGGYQDLVFPGSGSVYDPAVPLDAAAKWLEHHPEDDFFYLWCDAIIGILAPNHQLDERFTILPAASNGDRMANIPGAKTLKHRAITEARRIRDRRQL